MDLSSRNIVENSEVVNDVAGLLKEVDSGQFSNAALAVLKWKTSQYFSDLARESAVVARMHEADSISARHVEIAGDHLVPVGRKNLRKLTGTIGGVGLGTSLSTLCAMMLVWQFPLAGILICVFFGIVGGFSLALSVNRS